MAVFLVRDDGVPVARVEALNRWAACEAVQAARERAGEPLFDDLTATAEFVGLGWVEDDD